MSHNSGSLPPNRSLHIAGYEQIPFGLETAALARFAAECGESYRLPDLIIRCVEQGLGYLSVRYQVARSLGAFASLRGVDNGADRNSR